MLGSYRLLETWQSDTHQRLVLRHGGTLPPGDGGGPREGVIVVTAVVGHVDRVVCYL